MLPTDGEVASTDNITERMQVQLATTVAKQLYRDKYSHTGGVQYTPSPL